MVINFKNFIKSLKIYYHYWMVIGFEDHTKNVAYKHLTKLVDLEDEWGLYEFARYHLEGEYIERSIEKAIFYYKRAFEKKGKLAQYSATNIGSIYFNGDGIQKNEYKAAIWYKKAAKLGNIESQYNYGLSLFDGWGEEHNEEKGLYWLTKAAEAGVPEAIEVLKKLNILD